MPKVAESHRLSVEDGMVRVPVIIRQVGEAPCLDVRSTKKVRRLGRDSSSVNGCDERMGEVRPAGRRRPQGSRKAIGFWMHVDSITVNPTAYATRGQPGVTVNFKVRVTFTSVLRTSIVGGVWVLVYRGKEGLRVYSFR